MYQKSIKLFFLILIILIILSSNISESSKSKEFSNSTFHYNSNSTYSWPLFGYYSISSKFGYRKSPTTGASTYHSGIDIPAPPRN